MPGDVLVGDCDSIVVILAAMANQVAIDGTEQERLERYLKARIEAGPPAIGTYPTERCNLVCLCELEVRPSGFLNSSLTLRVR